MNILINFNYKYEDLLEKGNLELTSTSLSQFILGFTIKLI